MLLSDFSGEEIRLIDVFLLTFTSHIAPASLLISTRVLSTAGLPGASTSIAAFGLGAAPPQVL